MYQVQINSSSKSDLAIGQEEILLHELVIPGDRYRGRINTRMRSRSNLVVVQERLALHELVTPGD